MALVYFDSSALVKLMVEEPGTDLVAALWDGCDAALSSRLGVSGGTRRPCRRSPQPRHRARAVGAALRAWEEYWSATRPVELTDQVERRAGLLAEQHALTGADAVHLASALALDTTDLILAVWDRRLHAGARAEHLAVAPIDLDR